MRFIDLFAGLGGFHLALQRLGHTCVFASELDPQLRALYKINFGMDAEGDIKQIDADAIPAHDVLCAGFPCQPFSKAGEQNGFDDPKWGDLFDHLLRIVRHHHPRFLMLENVPNFAQHDKGNTWRKVEALLKGEKYDVRITKLSPHRYGIPQVRERIFIVGSRTSLDHFKWPDQKHEPTCINTVLDENPPEARKLSEQFLSCIAAWQDFLDHFPPDKELPSFPIWSMEFGATYPFEHSTPHALGAEALRSYRGSQGQPLQEIPTDKIMAGLPSYARSQESTFPAWKVQFIRQNREFYRTHQRWIDEWRPKILAFPSSLQKFEWNCKGEVRDIWKYVIQFRASGVRVKRPTTAPSLVAMTTTQVPIIAWEKRYMTPRECARLQSMGALKQLPAMATNAYKALGNAVNADLVAMVAERLFASDDNTTPTQSGAERAMVQSFFIG